MAAKKQGKRVTLYDVAESAGVSHQTVSRVINDYPHISTATRNKVLRAIRELGYRPNRAAQILNTRRSYMLEVVMPSIWATHAPTIAEMATSARAAGYQITIAAVAPDDVTPLLTSARARLIDGLILSMERLDIAQNLLIDLAQEIPVVKIQGTPTAQIASVIYDQRHGARLATEHLIKCGHRQIAEIMGQPELYDARARHESWLETLDAHDLAPGPGAVGHFSTKGGYEAMRELLASGESFTAVVAGNDNMAQGAMFAIFEQGLRVPDDISLVGFDDIPAAPYFTVPLTTVRQDSAQIGRLAVEYLVSIIETPDTPIHQRVILPELVVRQSTRTLNE